MRSKPNLPANCLLAFFLFSCFSLFSQNDGNLTFGELKILKFIQTGDSVLSEDPQKAAEYYQKAYQSLHSKKESLQGAQILNKLGKAEFMMGKYPEALSYMQEALKIYERNRKDSLVAEQLSNIGSAYYFSKLDENSKALKYYEKAYRLFSELGYKAAATFNSNYTAYIYWARGEKEKALRIHKRALAVFDSLGNNKGRAISTSDIGFTLNSLGKYREALQYNLRALDLSIDLADSITLIPVLNNTGISYQQLGKLKEAEKFSLRSLAMARKRDLRLRVKEALETLHTTYALANNHSKAYETLLDLNKVSDSISNTARLKMLLQMENRQAFKEKEYQIKLEQARKEAAAEANLKREVHLRNSLIVVILLLLALGFAMLKNLQLKNKNAKAIARQNKELAQSQKKIEAQNKELIIHQKSLENKNKELEKLLKKLKEAQAKVVQYEKLVSLGILVSGMAHEINNPLNFIQGGIYGLEDLVAKIPGREDRDMAGLILGHMLTGVQRATGIVSELNEFSKNSSRKDRVVCHIHKILENCLIVLQPKIDEYHCSVKTEFAKEDLAVIAHEGSLHQIFTNLIYNSILAVSEKGEIIITTKKLPGQNVEIEIKDNGCGMEPEVMDKIFDPFFTTRPAGSGTGLGLYISYKLVKSHQGAINFWSKPGVGTIATVHLPKNPAECPVTEE